MSRKRRPLVVGNWKMHLTHREGAQLVEALAGRVRSREDGVEVAVCPPFTALDAVGQVLQRLGWPLALGAQDVHWEDAGPFTGEVSPAMLAALGCRYVIVGHSERRSLFGEGDDVVGKKAAAVARAGMVPIVCVGETLEQRRAGAAERVVAAQLEGALAEFPAGATLVVAYEPVWAIGTGEAADPGDAQRMARFIRGQLARLVPSVAAATRILYGGSVQADNAAAFFLEPDVDGALVGGASLRDDAFARIVEAAIP